MSEKPVVKAQECDPSTLGLARKPRPALKRKPQTEVVVQLLVVYQQELLKIYLHLIACFQEFGC